MTDATLFEQPEKTPMNAVAKRESAEIVPADASSVMALIDRAARDPNVDIDKMERLMGMAERMSARQAEQAFNEAMNAAQAELQPVAANADNPQTHSKYASYTALDREVRPIYSRHGFSLSFNTAEGAPAEHVRLVCKVRHRDGHTEPYHVDMPADGKGAKGGDVMTKTHAAGAAMSYGQRYLLKLIFNIAVGVDDDGNSNGGREMGAAAQKAIESINAHTTPAEHIAWRDQQAAGVEKVVAAWEWKEIIALWNKRAKALKGAAPAAQPDDDFPGDRR
jgi:hypothetical protein